MSPGEQKLREDMKTALRSKDALRTQVLRAVLAAAKNRAIELRVEAIPESELVTVLKREAKQRAEALDFARQAGREDLVREHEVAVAIVESYLPKQLSENELRSEIEAITRDTGASDSGSIMKELGRRHAGRYDGKLASRLAGEFASRGSR
jgi:uncharacterized protein YqeY